MTVRVLVAYATKLGSTREIAEVIGKTIHATLPGAEVDVLPAASVHGLTDYDAVVLGSALYAAHWRRDANRFVQRHRAELTERPVWLFSSGPLDHSADAGTLPATPAVAAATDPIGARGHRTFGGRLQADAPGIEPQILATHPIGDFRDWATIRAWATAIAVDLRALRVGASSPATDRSAGG
jgi:menaquinone-dependent protoporphyrinogen oxidase